MMRFIVAVILLISLIGCSSYTPQYVYTGGQMIPGRLISLSDGSLIPLQIELSNGQGQVFGTHPTTGEVFNGSYVGVADVRYTEYTTDNETTQAVEVSTSVPASAILLGDQGTVINILLHIKPGTAFIAPIGYGEGTDNHGEKYNLQF